MSANSRPRRDIKTPARHADYVPISSSSEAEQTLSYDTNDARRIEDVLENFGNELSSYDKANDQYDGSNGVNNGSIEKHVYDNSSPLSYYPLQPRSKTSTGTGLTDETRHGEDSLAQNNHPVQSTAPIVQYDYQSPPASIPGFNLTEKANNNTLPSAPVPIAQANHQWSSTARFPQQFQPHFRSRSPGQYHPQTNQIGQLIHDNSAPNTLMLMQSLDRLRQEMM